MDSIGSGCVVHLAVPIDLEKARKYQQHQARKRAQERESQQKTAPATTQKVATAEQKPVVPPVRPKPVSKSAVDLLADHLFPDGL